MKSLYKKISVIMLTGLLLIGSGFSQGFVAHAANSRLLDSYLLRNPNQDLCDPGADLAFLSVKENQNRGGYDALYLGNSNDFKINDYWSSGYRFAIPQKSKYYFLNIGAGNRYYYLTFKDEVDFENNINKLNQYKRHSWPLIVKVGESFFEFIFDLTNHERNVVPIKSLAKLYGFNVAYAESNDWYGLYEFQSYLDNRDDFKKSPQIKKNLEKVNLSNTYKDAEDFAYDLRYGYTYVTSVYTRYRIGGYDYILYK